MKIGLLGYGTVGREVVQVLHERLPDIEVKTILRRAGKATGPGMTDRIEDVLDDPEIDCVVEALSGRDPALDYIRRALQAGKHVVTSNKAALAAAFGALHAIAREHHVHLLYEASAGGGIPWLEGIKKAIRLDEITTVSGILNGTSNFILDKMEREDVSFEDALADAQALGYAEADPTADLSGADLRNKALISASLAYRDATIQSDIPVTGIQYLTHDILKAHRARGKVLRLMMLSRRVEDRYALGVVPVLCDEGSFEHAVKKNLNAGFLSGDIVGPLTFIGQGAGGKATADAIVQDLIAIQRQTADTPLLDRHLTYDASLLTGCGYFGDGHIETDTLAELIARAHRQQTFLAFDPARTE